jgi:hypothetical protein
MISALRVFSDWPVSSSDAVWKYFKRAARNVQLFFLTLRMFRILKPFLIQFHFLEHPKTVVPAVEMTYLVDVNAVTFALSGRHVRGLG